MACRRSGFPVRRCSVKSPATSRVNTAWPSSVNKSRWIASSSSSSTSLRGAIVVLVQTERPRYFQPLTAIAGRVENHEFVPAFSAPEEAREQIFWSTSRPRVGM